MGRFNKGIAALAAMTGLLFSTAAASAQTRVAPTQASTARASTPTRQDAHIAAAPIWLLVLLGALVAAGVIAAATSGGGNDQSPESP